MESRLGNGNAIKPEMQIGQPPLFSLVSAGQIQEDDGLHPDLKQAQSSEGKPIGINIDRTRIARCMASDQGRRLEQTVMLRYSPRSRSDMVGLNDLRLGLRDYHDAVSTFTRSSGSGEQKYQISPILFSREGFLAPLVDQTCWMMAYLYLLKHKCLEFVDRRAYAEGEGQGEEPGTFWIPFGASVSSRSLLRRYGYDSIVDQSEDEDFVRLMRKVKSGAVLGDAFNCLWGVDARNMITLLPYGRYDFLDRFVDKPLGGEVTPEEWLKVYLPASYRFISGYFREEAVRLTVSLMTMTRLLDTDVLGMLGGTVFSGVEHDLVPEDWGDKNAGGHGTKKRNRRQDVADHNTSSSMYMRFDGLHVPADFRTELGGPGLAHRISEYSGDRLIANLAANGVEDVGLIEIKTFAPGPTGTWYPPDFVRNIDQRQALWYTRTFQRYSERIVKGKVRMSNVTFVYVAPQGLFVMRIPITGEGEDTRLVYSAKEWYYPQPDSPIEISWETK